MLNMEEYHALYSSASYLLCVNLSTQLRMLYYDFIQMHELHIALSTLWTVHA